MQWIFWICGMSGILYVTLARRRFDWFTISFLSACVYFASGFLGHGYLYGDAYPLGIRAYAVMTLVLAGLLAAAVLSDRVRREDPSERRIPWIGHPAMALWLVIFCFLFYKFSYEASGDALFYPSKGLMMETFTRWHVLWKMSAIMAAVFAFTARRYILFALAMAHVLFLLYIGFRTPLVVALIGIVTIVLYRKGPQRLLLDSKWAVVILAAFVVFVFAFKQVYVFVKMGRFQDAYEERIASDGFLRDAFLMSEATLQGLIIHEVIESDLRVGMEHLEETFSEAFLNPFRSMPERVNVSFNEKFQPVLFKEVRGGLASSIWAEMWSAGGWWLLIAWVLLYVVGMWGGVALMRHPDLQGALACWLPFWAFFIHRNDLNAMLSFFFKQFLFLLVLALLCVAVHDQFLRWLRPGVDEPTEVET